MAHEHRIRRRVEFSETDMAGIVHFAQFFRYMESAEHEFFRSLGLSIMMEVGGQRYGWPRVHAECDYQSPLRFEEEFEVLLRVRDVRARSIVYDFLFTKIGDPAPVARGSLVTVCVQHDGPRMSAVSIPEPVRAKITPAPPAP